MGMDVEIPNMLLANRIQQYIERILAQLWVCERQLIDRSLTH